MTRRAASVAALWFFVALPFAYAYLSPPFQTSIDVTTPPPSELVIYLPLDGNLNDQSGNNNNGTFSGGTPSYVSASWGTALDCDGLQNRVDIASDPSFTNVTAYTVAACINLDTYGGSNLGRIMQQDDLNNDTAIDVRTVSSFSGIDGADQRYATTGGRWTSPTNSIQTGTTYHVAWTYDTSTQASQIYIDGSPVTTTVDSTPAGAFSPDTAAMGLCNNVGPTAARGMDGRLGHFRFYNAVQSAGTIATLASDCSAPTPGQCPGDTCYVRIGGSDSNGCTNATTDACASIQRAADLAEAGDTIDVGTGTWNENVSFPRSGTSGNPITLSCAGPSNTIIQGDRRTAGTWVQDSNPPRGDTCPNCYRQVLATAPGSMSINGGTERFVQISNNCMASTSNCIGAGANGFEWLTRPSGDTRTIRGVSTSTWAASDVVFGYDPGTSRTWIHFQDGTNPNTLTLTYSGAALSTDGTLTASGVDYITVQNCQIRNGLVGIRLNNANNIIIQDNQIINGDQGVYTTNVSATIRRNTIRYNQRSTYSDFGAYSSAQNDALRSVYDLHFMEQKAIEGDTLSRQKSLYMTGNSGYGKGSILFEDNTGNAGITTFGDGLTMRWNVLQNGVGAWLTILEGSDTGHMYGNTVTNFDQNIRFTEASKAGGNRDWFVYNNTIHTYNANNDPDNCCGQGQLIISGNTGDPNTVPIELAFYHNSLNGGSINGGFFTSPIFDTERLPQVIIANNLWNSREMFGTGTAGLKGRSDAFRGFCNNWVSSTPSELTRNCCNDPTNVNEEGNPVSGWVQLTDTDPNWTAIPASAQNAGVDITAIFNCGPSSSLPALPWDDTRNPYPGGTPNIGVIR